MKKRTLPLVISLLLALGGISAGESIEVRHVSELVKPADLIARVTILSVRETGAKEGYGKVARAFVTEAVKGVEEGDLFELENDVVNIACPNVSYQAGEDVLLFAKKTADGRYATLYADAGKFPIKNERVEKQPFVKHQTYRSAVAQVKGELSKLETAGSSDR